MNAFISALVVIAVVSGVAAVTLNNFAGSSQNANTSASVRVN